MGTNECSQPASKSSWDSLDFGDISMVLRMAHFRKSTGPRWVKYADTFDVSRAVFNPSIATEWRRYPLQSRPAMF